MKLVSYDTVLLFKDKHGFDRTTEIWSAHI
jgi:hypothetical protein